jgi:hypothetical protein
MEKANLRNIRRVWAAELFLVVISRRCKYPYNLIKTQG